MATPMRSSWLARILAVQERADVRVVVGEEIPDFKHTRETWACKSFLPRHPALAFCFIADGGCDASAVVSKDQRNEILLRFHTFAVNGQHNGESHKALLLMVMHLSQEERNAIAVGVVDAAGFEVVRLAAG